MPIEMRGAVQRPLRVRRWCLRLLRLLAQGTPAELGGRARCQAPGQMSWARRLRCRVRATSAETPASVRCAVQVPRRYRRLPRCWVRAALVEDREYDRFPARARRSSPRLHRLRMEATPGQVDAWGRCREMAHPP